MKEKLISLKAGALNVALAPAAGASIARFTVDRGGKTMDVMRPAPDGAIAADDPHGMASFPMIPFCGRIAQARFAFGGEAFELNRNFGESPHAIHGNAWKRPWRVAARTQHRAELVLDHDPAGREAEWPFAYSAQQAFTLTPDALQVAVEVTNRDRRAMPLGFGLHPYFPMTPQARLTARVDGMWENDATMQPLRQVKVPADIDFSGGRSVGELAVDNCFTGWALAADLAWPEHALALRIEADLVFGHFVVYTPPHREYFCAEPQTVAPDAINLAARGIGDTGLIVLAPGATQRGAVRFAVRRTV
jgi:aldose 1-epimerase